VAVLLLGRFGSEAVVIGYLAGAALHLVLNLTTFRLRYKLQVRAVHLGRLAFGAALVVGLSVLGSRETPPLVLGAGVVAWLLYTVYYANRSELIPELKRRFAGRAA
jgi:hypothetical protein